MSRLLWADRLKGCLIILVVLGHAIQHAFGPACEDNHLWNIIYSFHMPAFMAVSGYLVYRPQAKRVDLSRRFLQLMVPFLAWSLIMFLLNPPYQAKELASYILKPDTSFWFLWVLFWIAVLFWVGDWLAERLRVKQEIVMGLFCIVLVAIMVFVDVRVLGMQFISYYFLFYVMGYYLHKYDGVMTTRPSVLIPLTILWAVLAWFWKMHSLPAFLAGIDLPMSLMNYGYRFVTAMVAVYVLLCASPSLLGYRDGHDNLLIFCGVWSLGIYVVHLLLMPYIRNLLGQSLTPALVAFIAFVSALVVSMLAVFLLSKFGVTKKVLLGKLDSPK